MSLGRYMVLILCCLQCMLLSAQSPRKVPFGQPLASDSLLVLHFEPSSSPRISDGILRWDGLALGNGMVGAPDLPTASTLVRLPQGSKLEINSVDGGEVLVPRAVDPRMPLPPVAEPWIKDGPQPTPMADKSAYAADTLYRGGPLVQLDDLGALGGWQYFRITLRPVAYNPVTGDLAYHPRLTLTLTLTLLPPAGYARLEGVPERYLIVSRPWFREALQPFVQWKRQEGYDVVERYADSHQRDSVRALIEPLFTEASPVAPVPRYVLLVGDAAELQSFVSNNHPSSMDHHLSDFPYVSYGTSMLPSAHIGRWPVSDTAALGIVLRKTLAYEQGRGLDTAALRRVLLVAGRENTAPAPTTTNGQVNYLKRELTLANPTLDALCHYNPASGSEASSIASEIGQGIGLLNYTAHCTVGGWSSPAVSASTFDTLPSHMPLLYVNNCCKSNDFGGTGFGEQLLRRPHGGAIGVIGATNSTLWNEDYYWAVGPKLPISLDPAYQAGLDGAFDRWTGRVQDLETQGELLAAGNLAVTAYGSPYSSFYWQTYCLFGDPALRPYLGIPGQAMVSLTNEARNGQSLLHLTGTPGAIVTALQDSLLLGVARLDSLGSATMPLRHQLEARPLILTATGRNLLPAVDTLAVHDAPRGLALRNTGVVDSVVRCTVENIGAQCLDSLRVTLSQSATDSLMGVWIAGCTVVIDSLLPGASQMVSLPFSIRSIGHNPLLLASVTACADSVCSTIPVRSSLPDVRPSLTLRLLCMDGTEARRINPATTYRLCADIEGVYDSLHLRAIDLTTDSTSLTFTTPAPVCSLQVSATIYRDAWHREVIHWLVPGERIESFEEGFASHPWDTACRVPWTIDSTVSHSGNRSARTGAIGHDQTSDLTLEVYLPHDDTISFWAKLSTEPQHDQLVFSVDGERMQPVLWGELGWRQYKYRLTAGRHTLRWRYLKDQSTSRGSDCVWIDDINLPLAYWDMPAGWECRDSVLAVQQAESAGALLSAYPNPSSGKVTLQADEAMDVVVLDALGRRVARFHLLPSLPHTWDASQLPAGIYFARGVGNGKMNHCKIVILDN